MPSILIIAAFGVEQMEGSRVGGLLLVERLTTVSRTVSRNYLLPTGKTFMNIGLSFLMAAVSLTLPAQ